MLCFGDMMESPKQGGANMKLNPVEDRYTRRMRDRERTLLIARRRMDKRVGRDLETKSCEDYLTSKKVEYIEQNKK